ncbi:hypothetical protein AN414_25430 [Serratia marcescens]|nr:hypothetical protein AN414_25430 [Serratia marcescens]
MPQSDGSESQAFRIGIGFVPCLGTRFEALITLQPAEVLDVFRASGVKAASSGISLQHTQQLVVVESLAFMVAPLH